MTTTLSHGTAASGGSLALVTILIYLLSLKGIQVPDTVAIAISSILTTAFHYLIVLRLTPGRTIATLNQNGDERHVDHTD
jgi:uncharacterized membrane protein